MREKEEEEAAVKECKDILIFKKLSQNEKILQEYRYAPPF